MEKLDFLPAGSLDDAFSKIKNDFATHPDLLTYQETFNIAGNSVEVFIDIDLGGGFEGGFAITNIKSMLLAEPTFRFALYHENFMDEIGKFFGMEDIEIGYPEFDKKVVIKTDDPSAIHPFFEDRETRKVFGKLKNFNLGITYHHDENNLKQPYLEFEIEEALDTLQLLKPVFYAYFNILKQIRFIN
jgi:hypothetical protein